MESETVKTTESDEAVVQAVGELSATVKDAAMVASEVEMNHEDLRSWLTTIIKAIVAALKP